MVHKALEDVVQSVLEQAYSPPLVFRPLNIVSTCHLSLYMSRSFLCITVRDKDLQLRFSFLVLDFRAGQITGLSVNVVDTVKMFAFTKPQVVEEPVSLGLLAMPEDVTAETLTY